MSAKYIFVTGGVVSSLGKGLSAASIGCLLEARGIKVNLMKFDPYLNVDPGTMSPFQHGEVFVTDDGAETDLDLGHYERFTHSKLTRDSNLTTGRIYEQIITKERRGDYLGKTVQVIPHVTNEIKNAMRKVAADCDIAIVEIGGTVGDIESLPFLEAIRQMRQDLGRDNTVFVHVTLIPWIAAAQELKTKPTQHSVKEMLSIGIQPDILLCRSDRAVPRDNAKQDRPLLQRVEEKAVIAARDVPKHLRAPLSLAAEGADALALHYLHMDAREPDLSKWQDIVHRAYNPQADEVAIGIVGKYVEYEDSYKSLKEALVHGALAHNLKLNSHLDRSRRPRNSRRTGSATLPANRTATTSRQLEAASTASWSPAASASAASRACSTPSATPARTSCALLRHLPRHADRLHRIRPQRRRPRPGANSGEFDPATPLPHHL